MKQPKTNPDSLIENYLPADYYDSFSKESHNKNVISIDEFADIAFNQLPSSIILLLIVRNSLIKPSDSIQTDESRIWSVKKVNIK